MANGKTILTSLICLILITVLFISGCETTGNVVQETMNEPEEICREVQTPYTEEEGYYESEPYTDQECTTRELEYYTEEWRTYPHCIDWNFWSTCIELRVSCIYTLKNIDNVGGTWTIGMKVKNLDLMSEVDLGTKSIYIPQTISKTFEWIYDTNRVDDSFICEITSFDNPTTTECHDVIKYRDVYKTRIVTKYKTETICE